MANSIKRLHYEIMRRCYKENYVMYKTYGAKNIKVCDEWHDFKVFEDWCLKNGYEYGKNIERIDGSKDYSPDNCRFGNTFNRKDTGVRAIHDEAKAKNEMLETLGIEHGITKSSLYKTYFGMIERCCNQNHSAYKYYGGKGIKVCDEWLGKYGYVKFYLWAMENGWVSKATLDRIDANGGYYPDNCRWVSMRVQSVNKSKPIILHNYKEGLYSLTKIAKIENIPYDRLKRYMENEKISAEDAVSRIKEDMDKGIYPYRKSTKDNSNIIYKNGRVNYSAIARLYGVKSWNVKKLIDNGEITIEDAKIKMMMKNP